MQRPKAFLSISVGGAHAGRVVVELRPDVAPLATENFLALCRGDRVSAGGRHLTYARSSFHRVIPGFMVQGGDFTAGNGTGGESVFGKPFVDEHGLKHDAAGVVAMANAGPCTNASQFYITLAPAPFLDGKHTVFGRVVAGMDAVRAIEAVGSKSGSTSRRVCVEACGVEEARPAAAAAKEDGPRRAAVAEAEDPDAASTRRLLELARCPAGTAAAAAFAPPAADPAATTDAEAAGAAWQGMDPRQRKLFELRLKLNESRKANQSAVVAEKRRADGKPDAGAGAGGGRAKRGAEGGAGGGAAERLGAHGIADASKAYLLESAEMAEARARKASRKCAPESGRAPYGPESAGRVHERRAAALQPNLRAYAQAAAAQGVAPDELLSYGSAVAAPAAVDRLVEELEARQTAARTFSRRRKHFDDSVDGINDRNATFIRRAERDYGKHTAVIKANLERGTALPDR